MLREHWRTDPALDHPQRNRFTNANPAAPIYTALAFRKRLNARRKRIESLFFSNTADCGCGDCISSLSFSHTHTRARAHAQLNDKQHAMQRFHLFNASSSKHHFIHCRIPLRSPRTTRIDHLKSD